MKCDASEYLCMDGQLRLRAHLQNSFDEIRQKNTSFSLRAMARRLGTPPSELSEILNGKRRISPAKADALLGHLNISAEEKVKIRNAIEAEQIWVRKKKATRRFKVVDFKRLQFVSDWEYYAVLSLIETDDFRNDPKWISARLGIRRSKVAEVLNVLEDLGVILIREGIIELVNEQLSTPVDIPSPYLRKTHFQNLDQARESLSSDSVQSRDFSAMTMAIDPEKLPRAKQMIEEFRRQLCEYLESGEKKEVFKICIQLFPLTRSIEDD